MVELGVNRYFDPRFLHFGITALVLKIFVYYLQSKLNPAMSYIGPDVITLKKDNSSASIHLFGATVTSWVADGQEMLFVSKRAIFDKKKPIRGGIPIVFPQFGPWRTGPQHGFARISTWTVKDDSELGTESITLVLEDTEITKTFWNYKFHLEYTITLVSDKQIKMDVVVTNPSEDFLPFTFLFHTYFSVPDVEVCRIHGLAGCRYIDKGLDDETFLEKREEVHFYEFIDRIYMNTPVIHKLKNVAGQKNVLIEKFNLSDTVVWNPWKHKAKNIPDFGPDEWKTMVCVEAGVVNTPVVLEPKNTYSASMILSID